MAMDPDWLKNYISHETLAAIASLELLAIVTLFFLLLRSYERRIQDLRVLAPLTDKLQAMVRAGARKRREAAAAVETPDPSAAETPPAF